MVRRAYTSRVLAVKILVEGYVVLEVLIPLEARIKRIYLAKALLIVEKDASQAISQLRSHLVDGDIDS